jgi:hypothetical protein
MLSIFSLARLSVMCREEGETQSSAVWVMPIGEPKD